MTSTCKLSVTIPSRGFDRVCLTNRENLSMRQNVLAVTIASLLVTFAATAEAASDKGTTTVKIIGLNDYHGNLESPGTFGSNTTIPVAQRPAVGGAEAIAAHVQRMKESNPNNVVVGAGDFIGATPLISALFYDEPVGRDAEQDRPRVQRRRQPRVRQGLGRVEATAVRRLQTGRRRGRPEQLPRFRFGERRHVRRRWFQMAFGQRHPGQERPAVAEALWHQGLQRRRARRLHRHDPEGHATDRDAHRRRGPGIHG